MSDFVRPLAGAGIEILQACCRSKQPSVRPLAGAGIEILNPDDVLALYRDVRPLAGAGIEMLKAFNSFMLYLFAPSRGRELK